MVEPSADTQELVEEFVFGGNNCTLLASPLPTAWGTSSRVCKIKLSHRGSEALRIPCGVLSDMQNNTFLETILLKELVKMILNCLSLKTLCHIHETETAKFHFPVSANLALFMNTEKAGNVYVQQAIEKVVLFVLSGKPSWYPSKQSYYFRERRLSQTFPKHPLLIDVT